MPIKDKIKEVKKQMLMEVGEANKPTCEKVSSMGLLAIHNGKGSAEWEAYMRLFVEADNVAQLNRLLAKDDTKDDPEMNRARAYLVADGPCTPDTVLNFGKGASDTLDQGL